VAARKDSGTVTAELVLTLPAVLMVLAFALSMMSIQLTRMELVSSASSIARAIARQEPLEVVDAMVAQAGEKVAFEIQESEGLICVVLKSEFTVLDLPGFELIETQCAKPQGQ
jgi:hypothetical protein